MKFLSSFKKSIYSALVFFGTLLVLSIGYAAYTIAPATPGGALTADNWNAVLSAVNDIDSRIAATELSISTLQTAGGSLWTTVTGGIGYSLGKVGIGTSTPNKDLHIYNTTSNAEIDIQSVAGSNKHWGLYQNASDESLRFWNNTAGGDVLTITKDGNVGIGAIDPQNTLEVRGYGLRVTRSVPYGTTASFYKAYTAANNEDPYVQFLQQVDSGWIAKRFGYIQAGVGHGGMLLAGEDGNGWSGNIVLSAGKVGIGTTSPTTTLDVNGNVNVRYGNYFTIPDSAGAVGSANGSWIGNVGQTLQIQMRNTWDGAIALRTGDSERMRIATNGNIWIGTANPSYKFEVVGHTKIKSGDSSLLFEEWSGNAALYLDGVDGDFAWSDYSVITSDGNSNLAFYTSGEYPRMTIASGGNVGIATTTPAATLDVNGKIKSHGRVAFWESGCINQLTSINGYNLGSLSGGSDAWLMAHDYGAKVTFRVYSGANCTGYYYTVHTDVTVRDSPQDIYWNSANFPTPVPGASFVISMY